MGAARTCWTGRLVVLQGHVAGATTYFGGPRPLPAVHALDRLAVSEAISRSVRNGRRVDVLSALNAGASSPSIGDVLDVPGEPLKAWVGGQRGLYDARWQALQLAEGCA